MAVKTVGAGKAAATAIQRCSVQPGRLYSNRGTDGGCHVVFIFFQFIQNWINFKNSKWVPYLAPKIPNICMRLTWDIMNNFPIVLTSISQHKQS
jgi:hypothetical protein